MRNFFQKTTWPFPGSKKEENEFGKAKRDILVCEECGAAFWQKSWHHGLENIPGYEKEATRSGICPACQMIQSHRYEGEIIIENIPDNKKEEIENLISNFSETAFERDPMDRIISIQTVAKGMLRILTTENQMAEQLAKKIKQTFKGKVSFMFSKRESTLRARIILQ
ncbi:MAG: NMD3-related protein [Candidatus Parcubacteria bacterium]|nr:NMD3-related protein [Candidatus Parcubacteria bacterium]